MNASELLDLDLNEKLNKKFEKVLQLKSKEKDIKILKAKKYREEKVGEQDNFTALQRMGEKGTQGMYNLMDSEEDYY